jgi:uncharacterized membrane protein YebE (DUF533 family)
MSMKQVLGMMLASRMAGRGARGGRSLGGGLGGGLGGLAAAGMLGGRRRGGGGLGRKVGLGALGYMAYRAYQDHQARNDGGAGRDRGALQGSGGGSTSGAAAGGGLGGALGGIMQQVSDALGGAQGSGRDAARDTGSTGTASQQSEPDFSAEEQQTAASFSEDRALLLVRAMVTAANADGVISPEERSRIMAQADEAGADAEDRRALERELADPRPLDALLVQVRDKETAEEFYLASRLAVEGTTETHRAYLARLRERLGLAEQEAAEIDAMAD